MNSKTLFIAAAVLFGSIGGGYVGSNVAKYFIDRSEARYGAPVMTDCLPSGYYPHPVGPGAGPPIRH